MTQEAKTIITAIANLAEAVEMSIYEGQAQANFSGRATTDPTGGGANATHCLSSGWMEETINAGYQADPRFFVSDFVGRQWQQALSAHNPVLYPWTDPNGI